MRFPMESRSAMGNVGDVGHDSIPAGARLRCNMLKRVARKRPMCNVVLQGPARHVGDVWSALSPATTLVHHFRADDCVSHQHLWHPRSVNGGAATDRVWATVPLDAANLLKELCRACTVLEWSGSFRIPHPLEPESVAPDIIPLIVSRASPPRPAHTAQVWLLGIFGGALWLAVGWGWLVRRSLLLSPFCAGCLVIASVVASALFGRVSRDGVRTSERRLWWIGSLAAGALIACASGIRGAGAAILSTSVLALAVPALCHWWAHSPASKADEQCIECARSWATLRALWKVVVPRAESGRCLNCGYDLNELATCRCPECGVMNYYLTDRADARQPALANGWIPASLGTQ